MWLSIFNIGSHFLWRKFFFFFFLGETFFPDCQAHLFSLCRHEHNHVFKLCGLFYTHEKISKGLTMKIISLFLLGNMSKTWAMCRHSFWIHGKMYFKKVFSARELFLAICNSVVRAADVRTWSALVHSRGRQTRGGVFSKQQPIKEWERTSPKKLHFYGESWPQEGR